MKHFTLWQKLNPLFWFQNADDSTPPDWHYPTLPMWLRQFTWFLRNPFHNLFFYVVGVVDREKTVTGDDTTAVFRWGFNRIFVTPVGWWISLPFLSYLNPHFRAYIGWRPNGALGFKLNISKKGEFTPP